MAGKGARIQVTGAREFRAALKRMEADVRDLSAIHKEAASTVASEARSRAPHLTGALAGTIRASGTKTRGAVVAGGRLVPYAGPIHFGWPARNIAPQPFIYDALDARKDEVVRMYDQRIGELVERVGRES